ncbi:MAG: ATP synthase subunit I [Mariprofundaceae bacterium]
MTDERTESSPDRVFWDEGVFQVFRRQIICGLVVAGFVVFFVSWHVALAVLYGVGMGLVNGYLMARRIEKASGMEMMSGQRVVYAGAVLRFVGVLLALGAAHLLGLHLLAVAGGYLVAQVASFGHGLSRARQGVIEAENSRGEN